MGRDHTVNSNLFSTIAGGETSTLGTDVQSAFIGGGSTNSIGANGDYSTIGGGISNNITCGCSTIAGGCGNQVLGNVGTIGGGQGNCTTAEFDTIGGGFANCATGGCSVVAGGGDNWATGCRSAVLGGTANYALAIHSVVGGGTTNCINAGGTNAAIFGGSQNCILTNAFASFIGGGCCNTIGANATGSGIVAGKSNTVSHDDSFIIGSNITTQADCTTFVNNLAYYAYGNATTYLADNSSAGEIIYAGNTSTEAGKIYFLTGSAGTPNWQQANAQTVNTSTNLLAVAVGSNSNTNGMLIRGFARYTSPFNFATGRPGDPLYLSDSPFLNGIMQLTPPASSGDIVRIMGYAIDATDELMYFDPDKSWVEIA